MENLNKLAMEYSKIKEEEKVIKKKAKDIGEKLREELKDKGLEIHEHGGVKVSYKPSEKVEVDEDILIDIVRNLIGDFEIMGDYEMANHLRNSLVEKVTVDENKIESLIYNNKLPIKMLERAYTTKTTYKLTVGKSKGKK